MVLERPYPSKKNIYKRFLFTTMECFLSSPVIFSMFIYPVLLLYGGNLAKPFRRMKGTIKAFGIRFTNFQATIGISRLEELEGHNSKRVELAKHLDKLLRNSLKLQVIKEGGEPIYYNYVIDNNAPDKLCGKLLFRGVDTDRFFNCDCSSLFQVGHCYPNAARAVKNLIQIPLYHQLKEKDIEYIALMLRKSINSGDE